MTTTAKMKGRPGPELARPGIIAAQAEPARRARDGETSRALQAQKRTAMRYAPELQAHTRRRRAAYRDGRRGGGRVPPADRTVAGWSYDEQSAAPVPAPFLAPGCWGRGLHGVRAALSYGSARHAARCSSRARRHRLASAGAPSSRARLRCAKRRPDSPAQRRASTQAPRRGAPAPPAASSRSVIRRLAHEMTTRQRSAVEIADAYLAAIAAAQPSLRAFLATTPEVARAAAAAVDARRAAGEALGPLAGIPLAIKARPLQPLQRARATAETKNATLTCRLRLALPPVRTISARAAWRRRRAAAFWRRTRLRTTPRPRRGCLRRAQC